MPDTPRWVGIESATEYSGFGQRTLRRYISEGRLPAYRVAGRLLRVDLNDLDELIRAGRVPTVGQVQRRRSA